MDDVLVPVLVLGGPLDGADCYVAKDRLRAGASVPLLYQDTRLTIPGWSEYRLKRWGSAEWWAVYEPMLRTQRRQHPSA